MRSAPRCRPPEGGSHRFLPPRRVRRVAPGAPRGQNGASRTRRDPHANRDAAADPPGGLPPERLPDRPRRSGHPPRSARHADHRRTRPEAEPGRRSGCAAPSRRRRTLPDRPRPRRRARRARGVRGKPCRAHPAPAAPAPVRAAHRHAGRSDREHEAHGPLPDGWGLLHPVRGGRLPPDHLLPRPAGRDVRLHDPDRGPARRGAGAARQRQTGGDRGGRRGSALRRLARSAPEARLPVRHRRRAARSGRGTLPHDGGARRDLRGLCRSRQGGSRRLCPRCGDPLHGLGRTGLRPRLRSRRVQRRRRLRLQHGGDGEQGPQHLQRQVRSRRPGDGDGRGLRQHRRSSPTSISTTGPAIASPAATGSSCA